MRLSRFLKAAVKALELRGVSSVSPNHPDTCSTTGGAGRGPQVPKAGKWRWPGLRVIHGERCLLPDRQKTNSPPLNLT